MAGHRKRSGALLLAEARAKRRDKRLQNRLTAASGDTAKRWGIVAAYMLTAIRRGEPAVAAAVVEQAIPNVVQHAEMIWQESSA